MLLTQQMYQKSLGPKHTTLGVSKPDAEEEAIKRQYAAARAGLSAQTGELQRRAGEEADRQSVIAGVAGSGAAQKMRQEALLKILDTGRTAEAGLGVEEAKAQQAYEASKKDRALQEKTFALQEKVANEGLKFQQMEFDENVKTNMFNKLIAAKQAGLKSYDDWQRLAATLGWIKEGSQAQLPSGTPLKAPKFDMSALQAAINKNKGVG